MSDEINYYFNEDGEKNFWFHGYWNNSIQKNIWEEDQDNSEANGFIRQFLQKCSGNKLVDMLKGVLSDEEKLELVKPDLESSFKNQSKSFENHMMLSRDEGTSNNYVDETLPSVDHLATSGGNFLDEIKNLSQSHDECKYKRLLLGVQKRLLLSVQTGKGP
jgi:hypothetical protein